MQDQQLFEYAVIRIVPRVEREEFLNVGVVLYCAKTRYMNALCRLDESRLLSFGCDADIHELNAYLASFIAICQGNKETGGALAQLPVAERFRWLTATRSTVVQTSKVHPGFCSNADEKLAQLFAQLVL